jgi:endonuclease I
MKKILSLFVFLVFSTSLFAQTDLIAPELTGSELIDFLQGNYSVSNPLSYNGGRDAMFEDIDGPDGTISCVYTGYTIEFTDRQDAQDGNNEPGDFNTEHIWPQSFFDSDLPMRSDIHHLFPTRQDVNGARSNYPFAEIPDNQTDTWYYNDSNQSAIPSSNIDEYSELLSSTSFEPREDFKGNVARAIFYFWAIYQDNSSIVNDNTDNEAFFNGMKDVLLQWHFADPVDEAEVQRSLGVESAQGNRNPFIHDTTLVRRAYFGAGPVVQGPVSNPVTGMISNINQPIFDLTFVKNEQDTTVRFLFTNELATSDTAGDPFAFTDYEMIFEAEVEWETGQSQEERIATSVRVIRFADSTGTTNEQDILSGNPEKTKLDQNYPNPFNPSTEIQYTLTNSGKVELSVYNLLGQNVATLVNRNQVPGNYSVTFTGDGIPSGIYFYRLTTESGVLTRRMTLVK